MDEKYDAIILGTGITECVLSALLSVDGKKILQIDRNAYYGAEGASLNLTQLYEKFRPDKKAPTDLGRDRDYAIDLIPKFMMASGELTKMLVHTDVTRYLEFKQIAASYVYRDGRIAKVPSTEMEAVRSSLMGLFEKRRAKKFFEFIQNWKDDDPVTHQTLNLDTMTMAKIFDYFYLEPGTRDFIGHAMALHLDDSYMQRPARETYERIILYTASMARYGKSPYIYPLYGMGELPQGFARLSAIYGGTYMLDKQVDEIVLDEESGKFVGVRCGEETVKADMLIGDPSYFRDNVGGEGDKSKPKVRETAHNTTKNQVNRKHDIYIAEVSGTHNICAKDVYIAQVSTIVETSTPELELRPGLELLGPIYDKFVSISPLEEPIDMGEEDNIFITRSLDATSHVETIVEDVRDVWKRATKGKELVLKSRAPDEGTQIQE